MGSDHSYVEENEDDLRFSAFLCYSCSVLMSLNSSATVLTGWGTNEHLIISILAHRNASQRKLIRQVYSETYGEDLLKALDKELSSDFEVGLC